MREAQIINVAQLYTALPVLFSGSELISELSRRPERVTPRGVAILITKLQEPEQILLGTLEDSVMKSKITGKWTSSSVELFDLLCAACSSSTPIVTQHEFTVTADQLVAFNHAYNKSRLKKYQVSSERTGEATRIVIRYPGLT